MRMMRKKKMMTMREWTEVDSAKRDVKKNNEAEMTTAVQKSEKKEPKEKKELGRIRLGLLWMTTHLDFELLLTWRKNGIATKRNSSRVSLISTNRRSKSHRRGSCCRQERVTGGRRRLIRSWRYECCPKELIYRIVRAPQTSNSRELKVKRNRIINHKTQERERQKHNRTHQNCSNDCCTVFCKVNSISDGFKLRENNSQRAQHNRKQSS